MDLRKSRSDTIDQHIQKYSTLLSSVLAQQQPERRFDTPEINSYFLRSLQNSNIPGEDWKGFITFLGKSWLTATKEQLYSDARTYYNTHIQPYLTEQSSEDSKVLAIRNMPQANRSDNRNFSKPTDNRNLRNNRGNFNRIPSAIPNHSQHHRAAISGATIIDVLATAPLTAKPDL